MAPAPCQQCSLLHAAYQRATATRLQAEGDLLSAIYSRNAGAIEAATQTAKRVLTAWRRAEADLHDHERSHAVSDRMRSATTHAC